MNIVRTAGAHISNRKVLENIQHLQNMNATRAGRRHGDDVVAAVTATCCLSNCRYIGCERFRIHEPAPAGHFRDDQIGNFTLVKCVRSLFRDKLKRIRKVPLNENLTGLIYTSIRLVEIATGCFVEAKTRLSPSQKLGEIVGHNNAVAGLLDRRLQQLPPRKPAVFLMCRVEPTDGSRDS